MTAIWHEALELALQRHCEPAFPHELLQDKTEQQIPSLLSVRQSSTGGGVLPSDEVLPGALVSCIQDVRGLENKSYEERRSGLNGSSSLSRS